MMQNNKEIKVAVCVSGAVTHSLDPCSSGTDHKRSFMNNYEILKNKFPTADFYYATWDTFEEQFKQAFPSISPTIFPEPEIPYHPYTGIKKEDHICTHFQGHVDWAIKGGETRLKWLSNATKQILIHTWLADTIRKDYDIIVRARFDGFISQQADFAPHIRDTFENHRVNGFTATRPSLFNVLRPIDRKSSARHNFWVMDNLIIHNADAINVDYVNSLHEQERLHASEYGWYQTLSMPHGSNHQGYSGWVCPDDRVLDDDLWIP
ncbi:MAG: hypothetical protein ACQ9ET_00560 [Nitrosomonadaceae bacterium]